MTNEVIESVNRITREMRRKQKPLKELTGNHRVMALLALNDNRFLSIRIELVELLRIISEEIEQEAKNKNPDRERVRA